MDLGSVYIAEQLGWESALPVAQGWPLLAHSRYKPHLTEHNGAVAQAAALLS